MAKPDLKSDQFNPNYALTFRLFKVSRLDLKTNLYRRCAAHK